MSLTIDERYNRLKQFCINLNNKNFDNFKNNLDIIGIIENVNIEFGKKYLNNIINHKLNIDKIDLDLIESINNVGNPTNYIFNINNKNINISPTTLRYLQFTLDIIYHIKYEKNLNKISIVEIGGGYGCQSILLYELSKLFDLTIDKYIILDLLEVNNLQKKYINKISEITNITYNIIPKTLKEFNNVEEFNYLISNYALGEFTKDWQDIYIKNIVSKILNGYICWNFNVEDKYIHEYFNKVAKSIKEENPQTNCYPIKSYIIKF